jgi:hypothetical protein
MQSKTLVYAAPFAAMGLIAAMMMWKAQHALAAPAAPVGPSNGAPQAVDRVMSQIVVGRIDEALGAIDFLKQQPDVRTELRNRLTQLADQQQRLYGYDIAAVQRFSDRLETLSVLAYYDQQPILFKFELYRPQGHTDQPWLVQSMSIYIDVMEQLKDTPVDYLGGRRNWVASPGAVTQ